MTRRPDELLDAAIAQARALRLADDVVQTRADEYVRWPRTVDAASRGMRRWWPAMAMAAAGAAAAIAVIVLARRPPTAAVAPPAAIVEVGPRVALAASPDARYAVRQATADATDIVVTSGAVTARLYPGAAPYRLRLVAGSFEVAATGTIFTLVVPAAQPPYAVVHEGQVAIQDGPTRRTVAAGEVWPSASPGAGVTAAAARLGAHAHGSAEAPATPTASSPDPAPAGSAPVSPAADAGTPGEAGPAPSASGPQTLEDRWRRARQLRGQGHPRQALDLLDELIARDDALWSPIALAEAMRIRASVLGDHRTTVQLARRFLDGYPNHTLRREVTELLCRAHRALGDSELPSACLLTGD